MVQPDPPTSVSQVQGIQTRATMSRSDGLFLWVGWEGPAGICLTVDM